MPRKTYKPGEKAPYSGQYEMIDTKGKPTGIERTVVKGEPFPPTTKPGWSYILVDRTKHK